MTTPFDRLAADKVAKAAWRHVTSTTPAPGAHLTDDDWVRLAAEQLDDDVRMRLADHIVACPACTEIFRVVAHVRRDAAAFDPGAPSTVDDDVATRTASAAPVAPSRPWGWRYGLAAAAVVALAVGAALWRATPVTAPGPRVAGAGATSEQANDPAPAVPPGPVPSVPSRRAWADLASAPAVTLPAYFTIVMRGDATAERDVFMAAFGPAIAPYRAGRYADAADALETLTARFPAVDEGWFYLGVARLYAGRAADAVEPLRRARDSEVVAAQARWFEAVALERAGRVAEATAALHAVCAADRHGHEAACATLLAPSR